MMPISAFVVAVLLAVLFFYRWRVAQATATSRAAILDRLTAQLSELQKKVASLSRYQSIEDADAEALRLVAEARAQADKLLADAQSTEREAQAAAVEIRRRADAEASEVRTTAKKRADKLGADADLLLSQASDRAQKIIADANAKAEAVAGDALQALRDARELQRAVEAMENTIKGYGDRYIVPTHTLLDDLAEHFGHTEAGQKLKFVRDQIRAVVTRGGAATCDYTEANRRTTAVRFVTDAFNGKAESILAKVRRDNIGTLRQELRDAFAIVNQNGKAFRNARITDEYMALREEELQWAAVAQELKDQEREEQRRIKEQLRDEEQARREYERALRDAEREEESLKKAMAKASEMLAKATDEQRAKYEGQLQELQQRLSDAEAKSQRAISMAQQTRRGHVYVISNMGSFGENVYKIGLTRRLDPNERVRELGGSSVPFEFDVHALIFSEDAPALETQLHRHFVLNQVNKVNHRREFFRVTLADMRQELESLGLRTSWTMAAAAREYRETQSIEQAIAGDARAREAWVKRQLILEATLAPTFTEPDAGVESVQQIAE